jgi:membrane protein DedA with SNARE-associated domain
MKEFLHHLIDWYQKSLDSGGYLLVAALMAIESTFIPIPSEAIIPFAAHYAQSTGKLSLVGIVIVGTLGSWVGATIMYWASRAAGRPLVLKFGKYFFVNEEKVLASERWAKRYGSFGVFVARLLPVVRHLIGIPMGIAKMNFLLYSVFTLVGSGIWCTVLTWVGVKAGQDEKLLQGDMHHITLWLVGSLAVIAALYFFFVHRHFASEDSAKKL